MKRFLSTTAVILTLTGTAYAQDNMGGFGTVTAEQGDFYASNLIGMRIYNAETEMENDSIVADGAETEWDDLGEINDIILSEDGQVRAVILGVGGFLGIGERDVSVSMDTIKIVREDGDGTDRFLVVNTTKEALENAPEYDRNMGMDADATAGSDTTMNNDTASNTATGTAATTAAATSEVANDSAEATEEVTNEAADATEEVANDAEQVAEQTADEAENKTDEMASNADTMSDREMLERPNVEREGYTEADKASLADMTAEDLEGTYVYGANDETVGEIGSLVLGDDGKIAEVVINVGGFLGIGEKPVAVTWDELQVLKNAEGDDVRIYIDSTEEALEAQPEYQQ